MMASTCVVEWFIVEPDDDHRQPASGSRPSVSYSPRKTGLGEPARLFRVTISEHRRHPETAVSRLNKSELGSHYERRSAETDATCNCTIVIGS